MRVLIRLSWSCGGGGGVADEDEDDGEDAEEEEDEEERRGRRMSGLLCCCLSFLSARFLDPAIIHIPLSLVYCSIPNAVRQTWNRSTFKTILLGQPTDPFSTW